MKESKITAIKEAYAAQYPELASLLEDLFLGRIPLDDQTEVEQAAQAVIGEESGQGFVADWQLRRKLELYAMEAATKYFESLEFKVRDVSKQKPYDLRCERGSEVIYCEVKGTRSLGEKIILTNGEVEFARQHKKQMALFICHSIRMIDEVLSDGQMRLPRSQAITSSLIFNPLPATEVAR